MSSSFAASTCRTILAHLDNLFPIFRLCARHAESSIRKLWAQ
jgi:hypothetical protein